MIRSEDDPAAKTVTQVDNSSAADETDNIWESCPECQDENLKIATEHMVKGLKNVHCRQASGKPHT